MNQQGILGEIRLRPRHPWMEFVLPLYTIAMIALYYQPQMLVSVMENTVPNGVLWWAVWMIIGGLGGLLALSALFLAFSLLYSPLYLMGNAARLLDRKAWVDRSEVRFYFGCFVILCGLLILVTVHPEAALLSFVLLAGFAQFLWRLLV